MRDLPTKTEETGDLEQLMHAVDRMEHWLERTVPLQDATPDVWLQVARAGAEVAAAAMALSKGRPD